MSGGARALGTVARGGLAKDLLKIREVYNEAWEKNWGFVPMTPEEMDFMAKRMKPLLVEELLWLAEAKRSDGSLETGVAGWRIFDLPPEPGYSAALATDMSKPHVVTMLIDAALMPA